MSPRTVTAWASALVVLASAAAEVRSILSERDETIERLEAAKRAYVEGWADCRRAGP